MINNATRAFAVCLGLAVAVSACESDSNPIGAPGETVAATDRGAANARIVDRMGIPTINTVFNHPNRIFGPFDFRKTAYNVASPADDVADYSNQFVVVLQAVGNDDATAQALANALLADELPVDLGAPATNFAMLNGRALADDAVDIALALTVPNEALQSDNVNENDREFRSTFPYVATPN